MANIVIELPGWTTTCKPGIRARDSGELPSRRTVGQKAAWNRRLPRLLSPPRRCAISEFIKIGGIRHARPRSFADIDWHDKSVQSLIIDLVHSGGALSRLQLTMGVANGGATVTAGCELHVRCTPGRTFPLIVCLISGKMLEKRPRR